MLKAQTTRVIIAGLVLVLLCTFGYFYTKQTRHEETPVGKTYEVVLTADGFKPSSLTVQVGDEVIFKSDKGVAFWPAANQHPIHADYPAFDPKKPVPGDTTWSFQFTEVGTWPYHDHLNSPLRGEVIVTQ